MGTLLQWRQSPRRDAQRRWGVRPWRPRAEVHLDRLRREHSSVLTAEILWERGRGRLATVVIGGFVPDASEAVFCQRRLLRGFGPVFYLQYPRTGFDRAAIDAQLLDLLGDMAAGGRGVVLLGVSFGCGVLAAFLDRHGHLPMPLAGVVMISPVLSLEDLGEANGGGRSLVGRFAWPLAEAPADALAAVETSVADARRLFSRLFAAGAQNRPALARLGWGGEGERLKRRILATVRSITAEGARSRLAELSRSCPLERWPAPLTGVPALVLFAEREDAVLAADAPVRRLLTEPQVLSPLARTAVVGAVGAGAVQHASLILHAREYHPPLHTFYRDLLVARRRARTPTELRMPARWPWLAGVS